MTPQEAAEKGWERFEPLLQHMSREEYIDACETLSCLCTDSANACQEDIDNEEAGRG